MQCGKSVVEKIKGICIMDLIFDCGATKTDVCLLADDGNYKIVSAHGFNPNYNDKSVLESVLNMEFHSVGEVENVFYYGTGCGSKDNCAMVSGILEDRFPKAHIEVCSDMMASARALFGDRAGVACILGTGSNSCFYNGCSIETKSVSLGYVLGDEGSGFDIGKKVLQSYFHRCMPADLASRFEERYNASGADLVRQIYDSQFPSRFVASFAKFANENIDHPFVREICSESFRQFIDLYIEQYQSKTKYPVAFSGSVAFAFRNLICECLESKGYKAERFIKSPLEDLVRFHAK